MRGTVRGRLGPAIAAAGLSARVPISVRCRRYARTAASRRAIVAGARPSARIVASHASISSVVASPTGPSIVARERREVAPVRVDRARRAAGREEEQEALDVGVVAVAHRGWTRFGGTRPASCAESGQPSQGASRRLTNGVRHRLGVGYERGCARS